MQTRRILLCETCEGADPGDADRLADALARADLRGIEVATVACMGACAAPQSLGLQGSGMATLVFDGVDPAADEADIIATARTWLAAPDGWIEDARPCGRLRSLLRTRTPALK